jgi:hypothetical protein
MKTKKIEQKCGKIKTYQGKILILKLNTLMMKMENHSLILLKVQQNLMNSSQVF